MAQIRTKSSIARFALLAALAAPAFALAQPAANAGDAGVQHGHRPSVDERVAELTTRLSLDARQQSSVRQILTDARTRLDAIRAQNATADRHDPAKFAEVRRIRDEADDRVWSLLRCDQKDAMRLLQREHREQRFAHHGFGPHHHGH